MSTSSAYSDKAKILLAKDYPVDITYEPNLNNQYDILDQELNEIPISNKNIGNSNEEDNYIAKNLNETYSLSVHTITSNTNEETSSIDKNVIIHSTNPHLVNDTLDKLVSDSIATPIDSIKKEEAKELVPIPKSFTMSKQHPRKGHEIFINL